MSNIVEGRAKLEALAEEMKAKGAKGTAQKLMNIVKEYLYRSHVGVAQGPKKVKRASKKAAAKTKPKAEKKAPAKTKPKAEKKAPAKPKAEKKAKAPAKKVTVETPMSPDMEFPANI